MSRKYFGQTKNLCLRSWILFQAVFHEFLSKVVREQRNVLTEKLVDGFSNGFLQIGLQVFEKLRLVADPDDQALNQEQHEKNLAKFLELTAIQKDRGQVHHPDDASKNEVFNLHRCQVDDLNDCNADR